MVKLVRAGGWNLRQAALMVVCMPVHALVV